MVAWFARVRPQASTRVHSLHTGQTSSYAEGRFPQATSIVFRLFDRVSFDIVGPLLSSRFNSRYILVLADYATHWVEAFPLPQFATELISDTIFREVMPHFGCPCALLPDQGSSLSSSLAMTGIGSWTRENHQPLPRPSAG